MKYALPIAKSNWPEGRVGPAKLQDSYRIQKKAVDLALAGKVDTVLVFSDFKPKNVKKIELNCMIDTCKAEGLPDDKMIIKSVGYDTLSVLKYAIDFSLENNADLVIISSQFHYPRVRWMAWRLNKGHVNLQHKVAFGIPRPMEGITDFILIFIYPIIDLIGLSSWFTKTVQKRRNKGALL